MVSEHFVTPVPMTVRALDAQGRAMQGVAISWAITSGAGDILNQVASTDANGFASADFKGTAVPGGNSIQQSTVTASAPFGSAPFFVTTSVTRFPSGEAGFLPLVTLSKPTPENNEIVGDPGGTVSGAVVVQVTVQSGPQSGRPVPNVGVRLYNYEDPRTTTSGACRSSNGIVLTDANGVATCDVVLNNITGSQYLSAMVGETRITPRFTVTIRPGTTCVVALQPTSQSVAAAGGDYSFAISTTQTCNWSVSSNASWIRPIGTVAGSGNGTVAYRVDANTGAAREGTLTVAGQTFTVSQVAVGTPGTLSITSGPRIPDGVRTRDYTFQLQAAGGREPYFWSLNTFAGVLPAGLNLTAGGLIRGTPNTAGTFTFQASVVDGAFASATRDITLTITNPDQTLPPTITNTGFPNGAVNADYEQTITSTNGCSNPVVGPSYRVSAGSLPPGLEVVQLGGRWAIRGRPTQAGAFTFSLAVTDPCGQSSSTSFILTIAGTISSSPLRLSPQALTFNTFAGSVVRPPDQSFSVVSEAQGPPLIYTVTAAAEGTVQWLEITSGATGSTQQGTVFVGVKDTQNLPTGSYRATITVSSPGVAPATLPVVLNVGVSPTISPSPASLTFEVDAIFAPTQTPPRKTITIQGPSGVSFSLQARTSNGANWLGVTPSNGTTGTNVDVIINHTLMPAGQYTGQIQVISAGSIAATIPVILTIGQARQFFWSNSGMVFPVSTAEPVPPPQTVILSLSGTPAAVTVAANTLSGGQWLKVTPASGTSPLSLTVTADTTGLQAGIYNGELVARTTEGPSLISSLRVTLLISETKPVITSVLHAASGLPVPLAPGSWAEVRGSFLGGTRDATSYKLDENGRVATTLTEARILVDGIPAPIISASAQSAIIQMPYAVALKNNVAVVAEFRGNKSEPFIVPIILINPAIFLRQDTQGRIDNQDGSANSLANPAEVGSTVTIYATGEGLTAPAGIDGFIAGNDPPKPQVEPVKVWIDGKEAEVVNYGGVTGMPAGLFQVKIKVPSDSQRGVPVAVTIGVNGNYTPDLVTMVVKPAPATTEEEQPVP